MVLLLLTILASIVTYRICCQALLDLPHFNENYQFRLNHLSMSQLINYQESINPPAT
ncbi:hypothetical protein AAZX31_06G216500 [Glycine max]|nr:hypothetical protein GLYMA_06G232050v4 [Glycine max]KAH1127262.1 hypothetical protein GYH30_016009 [Glycine max]